MGECRVSKARKGVVLIISFAIFAFVLFTGLRSNSPKFNNNATYNYFDYSDCLTFINSNENVPVDAVSIGDETQLKEFLLGEEEYGYLIADISLDWDGVGSTVNFANGRTLDGRGHTVTLSDKDADADVYDDSFGASVMNWSGFARNINYGLFVSVNSGVIKNIVFEYFDRVCAVNDGNVAINGAGIVCGENRGSIENCELNARGEFLYYYIDGIDGSCEFQTHFGGFAGKNGGRIINVKADYTDFYLRLRTIADSEDMFGESMIEAKTCTGGIAGYMSDISAECRNIVISGRNVVFNLTSNGIGDAKEYRYAGAVVADMSNGGRVDNVIVDFSPEYTEELNSGSAVSKNAVVYCGEATNVTAVNTYDGGNNILSTNCGCDEHKYDYCNSVYTDELTDFNLGMNGKGEQIIEIIPVNGYVESLSFTKYHIENGSFQIDSSTCEESMENFDSYNFDARWINGNVFTISPYQQSGNCCWEIKASSWRAVEFEFSDGKSMTYTGDDFINEFIKLKIVGGDYIDCDLSDINLHNADERIYEAIDVGEYRLNIKPTVKYGGEFLYYDGQNRLVAPFLPNHGDEIHTCTVQPGEAIALQEPFDWTKNNFEFALKDGADNAADGLVYTIDGGNPHIENSLAIHHVEDSAPSGSEYRVYLTKEDKRVTNDYVFVAKVDVCAPVVESVNFKYPIDGKYYRDNAISLKIVDRASGVASVKMNGMDMEMKDGCYVANISVSGNYRIVAIDNMENVLVYTFDALIDDVIPTLSVDAYAGEVKYESGTLVSSDVKFLASAVFGESGGEIQYRLDGGEWQVYKEFLLVKESSLVEFRALSYSCDDGNLQSAIIVYDTKIKPPTPVLDITADWFCIDKNKEYDATDKITNIELNLLNQNVMANFLIVRGLEFSARYSDTNAGENIKIIIDIWTKDNADIIINNLTDGIYGAIFRRKVTVTLISGEGTYGSEQRNYAYEVANAFDDIDLQFESNADIRSIPDAEDYRFWLKESEYGNYTVENFRDINSYDCGGKLIVNKAVIYKLANDESEFLDLDTQSIANLKFIFTDAIDSSVIHLLDTSYLSAGDGAYLPTDSINEPGTYTIKLYMPDDLKLMYVLDDSLYEIQLKIKEASTHDEEIPPIEGSDEEEILPDGDLSDENENNFEDVGEVENNDSLYYANGKSYSKVLTGVCIVGVSTIGVCAASVCINLRVKRKRK